MNEPHLARLGVIDTVRKVVKVLDLETGFNSFLRDMTLVRESMISCIIHSSGLRSRRRIPLLEFGVLGSRIKGLGRVSMEV